MSAPNPIVKVGSDNMPRLQFVLTERGLPELGDVATQPIPPNISFGLPGTSDVLIYPAAVVATRYQNRDAWFLESGRAQIVADVEQLRHAPPA